jgi:hypothetical protein
LNSATTESSSVKTRPSDYQYIAKECNYSAVEIAEARLDHTKRFEVECYFGDFD